MPWLLSMCLPLRFICQTSIGVKNLGSIHMCRALHWRRSRGSVRRGSCWPCEDCANTYLRLDPRPPPVDTPQEAERQYTLSEDMTAGRPVVFLREGSCE